MKSAPKIIQRGIFGTLGTHVPNPRAGAGDQIERPNHDIPRWKLNGFAEGVPSVPFSGPQRSVTGPQPSTKIEPDRSESVWPSHVARSEQGEWGEVPEVTLPVVKIPPVMTFDDEELLFNWVCRQPREVIHWCMNRGDGTYGEAYPAWTTRHCHLAASVDLAMWQLWLNNVNSLIEKMRSLEADYFRTTH
jgi:hypothetical protein